MKAETLEELLQAERGRKGFSQAQRAGLWKGIESSIGPIPDPGSGSEPEPQAPNAPPKTSPDAGPAGDLADVAQRLSSLKIAALVAVAVIGGAGLGAAAHARWAEPRIVVVERAAPVAAPPAPAPAEPLIAPAVAPLAAASSAAPAPLAIAPKGAPEPRAATSATPSPRDPGLARERTLLDMARTALSRGDTTAALAAVDNHAREFPASQLAEEREVLAIQALASANRTPEARRRAAKFRMSYPKSALLPIVEESTQ